MKIIILENGPILLEGPGTYKDFDNGRDIDIPGGRVALCRCGCSKNKPFCDGSHKRCDFNAISAEINTG